MAAKRSDSMITLTSYLCELCLSPYPTPAEALRCEAAGLPAPAPWFPLGALVPAFGESGVRWASATDVYVVRGYEGHEWALTGLRGDTYLSHNQDPEGPVLLAWFDPRVGYDAFRHGATTADLATWEGALTRYGMAEEECEEGAEGRVDALLAKGEAGAMVEIVVGLMRARGGEGE